MNKYRLSIFCRAEFQCTHIIVKAHDIDEACGNWYKLFIDHAWNTWGESDSEEEGWTRESFKFVIAELEPYLVAVTNHDCEFREGNI